MSVETIWSSWFFLRRIERNAILNEVLTFFNKGIIFRLFFELLVYLYEEPLTILISLMSNIKELECLNIEKVCTGFPNFVRECNFGDPKLKV